MELTATLFVVLIAYAVGLVTGLVVAALGSMSTLRCNAEQRARCLRGRAPLD